MGTARQNTEIVDIIRANHSRRGEKWIILFKFLRILTGSWVTKEILGFPELFGRKDWRMYDCFCHCY